MSYDHMHTHSYADLLQQSVGREDHDAIAKKMGAPIAPLSWIKAVIFGHMNTVRTAVT
jgi:hypothetical protein